MPLTRGTAARSTGLLTWVNQSENFILRHHFCTFMLEDIPDAQLKLKLRSILL